MSRYFTEESSAETVIFRLEGGPDPRFPLHFAPRCGRGGGGASKTTFDAPV